MASWNARDLGLDHWLKPGYRPCMGKLLQRYWGYIALTLAIAGWVTHAVGYAVIAVVSLLALVYFLFQAPLTCGAEIRGGRACRNNSHGLLLGCRIRQHKWQRARDVFVSHKWRNVFRDLTESPKDKLGTFSALISVLSLFVGLPLAFLK
jgi:hypothetical protein